MVPLARAQTQPAGVQAAFAKDAGALSQTFTALARVTSGKYHWKPAQGAEEAKAGTEWKIVNVLWEPTSDQTANAVFPCSSAERIDHVRPNRIDAADRVDK